MEGSEIATCIANRENLVSTSALQHHQANGLCHTHRRTTIFACPAITVSGIFPSDDFVDTPATHNDLSLNAFALVRTIEGECSGLFAPTATM